MAEKKCWFCNKNIKPGRGIIFVKEGGSLIYFCSSKCKKNYKLGRNPKKIRWAKRTKKKTLKTPKTEIKK